MPLLPYNAVVISPMHQLFPGLFFDVYKELEGHHHRLQALTNKKPQPHKPNFRRQPPNHYKL